jgi:hypothetical protein
MNEGQQFVKIFHSLKAECIISGSIGQTFLKGEALGAVILRKGASPGVALRKKTPPPVFCPSGSRIHENLSRRFHGFSRIFTDGKASVIFNIPSANETKNTITHAIKRTQGTLLPKQR